MTRTVNKTFHHTTRRSPMMYVTLNQRLCKRCGERKSVTKGCKIGKFPATWFVCAECVKLGACPT